MFPPLRPTIAGILVAVAAALASAQLAPTPTPAPAESPTADHAVENLIPVTPRIWSGGEPASDAAFDELAALGIKTIISVDGATPDLDAAHARGIRYVHAPFGYDGVPAEAQAVLKAALAASSDPVFIHCHHGRHRGPAAAAVAMAIETGATPAERAALLTRAGTGAEYAGLWADVAACDPAAIDATGVELVEVARVDDFAGHMAALDRRWDHLKSIRDAGWKTPPDHSDLVPAREATLAWESLREAARFATPDHKADPAFMAMLGDAEAAARALKGSLAADQLDAAAAAFATMADTCKRCHEAYRN